MADKAIIDISIPDNAVDFAKEVYEDVVQPTSREIGKFTARLPRAINAALSTLDQWIYQREHNVVATKKALELKLSNMDPDKIVSPEPYIAVPAMQAISYCIGSEELHDLYANLLSKAMVSDTKDNVHPSFVEIIKQMSPNDALTLKEFSNIDHAVPASTLKIVMKSQGMQLANKGRPEKICLDIITDLHIPNLSESQIRISMDNLSRLGLIVFKDINLDINHNYDFVKNSEVYAAVLKDFNVLNQNNKIADYINISKNCFTLTPLGKLFRDICIVGF